MSIVFDLGLFFRENHVLKINNKTGEKEITLVSAYVRGFLITIMCRIESNPLTWVSQESLAEELDITIAGLKKLSKKALDTNLIESMKNPSDKRKRLYRPAQFLIDWSQKRREELSIKDGLGVFFVPKN